MQALRSRSTAKCATFAALERKFCSQIPSTPLATTESAVAVESTSFSPDDLPSFGESLSQPFHHQGDVQSKDDAGSEPRRDLPVSPLMDPAFIRAKGAPHAIKAKPSKADTGFYQSISKNPYAQALAHPVRMCHMTGTFLPRFFLQDFQLVADPDTSNPYYLPGTLHEGKEQKSRPFVPKTHTLARKLMLGAVNDKAAGYGKNPVAHLLAPRIRQNPVTAKICYKASFRHDMDEFVLELGRRRACEMLVHLIKLKRGYMTGFENWDDLLQYSPQAAMVLWTNVDGDTGDAAITPGEFATTVLSRPKGAKPRKVPVHNLHFLLGEEKLDDLRKASYSREVNNRGKYRAGVFQRPLISIKNRNATRSLQLELWWLQGYLAQHKDYLAGMN